MMDIAYDPCMHVVVAFLDTGQGSRVDFCDAPAVYCDLGD